MAAPVTKLFSFLARRVERGGAAVAAITGGGGKTTLLYGLGRELAKRRRVLLTATTKIFSPTPDECENVFIGDARSCAAFLAATPRPSLTAAGALRDEKNKLHGYSPHELEMLLAGGAADFVAAECDGSRGRSLKYYGDHEPPVPQGCRFVLAVAGVDALGKKADEESVFRAEAFRALHGLEEGAAITEREYLKYLRCEENGPLKNAPRAAEKILILNKWDEADEEGRGRLAGVIPALLESYDAVLCVSERENILYGYTER